MNGQPNGKTFPVRFENCRVRDLSSAPRLCRADQSNLDKDGLLKADYAMWSYATPPEVGETVRVKDLFGDETFDAVVQRVEAEHFFLDVNWTGCP